MNEEIKGRIASIIFIVLFLIIGTYIVFGPRKYLTAAAANIYNSNSSDIKIKSNDKLTYNHKNYKFEISNTSNNKKEYEIILVNDYTKSVTNNCKVLSNNYLSYHIKYNGEYNTIRNVSLNGIIYIDEIGPNKIKDFVLNLWIDDKEEKNNNKNCYYPILKINEL